MGTLRIKGTIELNQFWPLGSSDADTTKMKLIVGEDSFQFKATGENVSVVADVSRTAAAGLEM